MHILEITVAILSVGGSIVGLIVGGVLSVGWAIRHNVKTNRRAR